LLLSIAESTLNTSSPYANARAFEPGFATRYVGGDARPRHDHPRATRVSDERAPGLRRWCAGWTVRRRDGAAAPASDRSRGART